MAEKLAERGALYQIATKHPNSTPALEREACFAALASLLVHLHDMPTHRAIGDLLPLHRLLKAIGDIDQGIRDPILTMPEGSGRGGRHRSSYSEIQIGTVAALADLLKVAGVSRHSEADKFVADEFARRGGTGHNGRPLTADTVREWRKRVFRNGGVRGSMPVARKHADACRSSILSDYPNGVSVGNVKERVRRYAQNYGMQIAG